MKNRIIERELIIFVAKFKIQDMNQRRVRVRFAPSPTGPLHMGGVRTALFNYFFAKKHGGDFLLRIEDTDQARFVPGAEEYIMESLAWCGIKIDEGVREGGPHAPYRQSERKAIYRQYADQLLESGNAYFAFDTPDDLEKFRLEAEKNGQVFTYNAQVRNTMTNSLSLNKDEVKQRIESGQQWVIRFKIPENTEIAMHDLIRGEVKVNSSTLDDKVLFKSTDGLPTYHLANVVDDYLMQISHVIRGEEWLPSLPLHVLLYQAFGWTASMPQFAHLPLLLKPTGNGKLSKRDGDKMGFPVFPLLWNNPTGEIFRGYREDGYFADAFVNLLALLGWNPGTEQEIFTMEELCQLFSLERVNKSGARFDPEKAKWFNAQYLKAKSNEELASLFLPVLKEKGMETDLNLVAKICGLIKDRAHFMHEFYDLSYYFFEAPQSYDEAVIKKHWKADTSQKLKELADLLKNAPSFTKEALEPAVHEWIHAKEYGMGQIMNTFRLCVVGKSMGPGMFEIAEIIGKEESICRIETAIQKINV